MGNSTSRTSANSVSSKPQITTPSEKSSLGFVEEKKTPHSVEEVSCGRILSDNSDYVNFWDDASSCFSSCNDESKLSLYIAQVKKNIVDAAEGKFMNKHHASYFEKRAIHSTVISIVGRQKTFPSSVRLEMNELLLTCMDYILKQLQKNQEQSLLQALHRILLGHEKHCPYYGHDLKLDGEEYWSCHNSREAPLRVSVSQLTIDENDAAWRSMKSWVRVNEEPLPLLFQNIQHFGARGGFEILFSLIQRCSTTSQIFACKLAVKIICSMRHWLTHSFMNVFAGSFVHLVYSKSHTWICMSDVESKKIHLKDMVDFAGYIAYVTSGPKKVPFSIDLSAWRWLQIFQNGNKTDQIKALDGIRVCIENFESVDCPNKIDECCGKNDTLPRICSQMFKNAFVLGLNIVDLWPQLKLIFNFLSRIEQVSEEHFDHVINASRAAADDVQKNFWMNLLTEMVSTSSQIHKQYIVRQLLYNDHV